MLINLAHWAFTTFNPIVILLLLSLSPAWTAVKMYSFLNINWHVMRSNMSFVQPPCCCCSLEEIRSFEHSIRCYWLKRRLQSPVNTLEWLLKRLSSIRNDFLWKNREGPPSIAHWNTTASWKCQIEVIEDWFWVNKLTFFPTALAALLVTGKWRLVCHRHGEFISPLFASEPPEMVNLRGIVRAFARRRQTHTFIFPQRMKPLSQHGRPTLHFPPQFSPVPLSSGRIQSS